MQMKQIVAHKKIKPIIGIAIILALIAFLLGIYYLLGLLIPLIGSAPCEIAFWVIGAAVAWWFLRRFVVKYSYTLTEDVLRLNSMYGKRERFLADIYLNRMLYVGSPEEAKRRNPDAKVMRVRHSACKIPLTAIAYKTSDGVAIALIQAEDELLSMLKQRMQKN